MGHLKVAAHRERLAGMYRGDHRHLVRSCFWRLLLVNLALWLANPVSALAQANAEAEVRLTLGKPFACADYGGGKICLVDRTGTIFWQYPAKGPQDVWVLTNGNILFSHVKGATEITRDKKVVWRYETDAANEVHACQPLPDGMVMVAESGPMQIIEIDRQMRIVKRVALKTNCRNTHLQMRCVRKLPNGHYVVGQYQDGVVREYDTVGNIVRDFAQPMAFSGIRLSSGNTLIATGDEHRVIEVDATGQVIWQIDENSLPGNPLRFVAGLQRLPNGNTLICNWGGHGYVGGQPQIVEVTRDKRVVGEIFDFSQFGTISGVFLLDVPGDPAKFEIMR
jgi:outer membrane protein assembly factor BamB